MRNENPVVHWPLTIHWLRFLEQNSFLFPTVQFTVCNYLHWYHNNYNYNYKLKLQLQLQVVVVRQSARQLTLTNGKWQPLQNLFGVLVNCLGWSWIKMFPGSSTGALFLPLFHGPTDPPHFKNQCGDENLVISCLV